MCPADAQFLTWLYEYARRLRDGHYAVAEMDVTLPGPPRLWLYVADPLPQSQSPEDGLTPEQIDWFVSGQTSLLALRPRADPHNTLLRYICGFQEIGAYTSHAVTEGVHVHMSAFFFSTSSRFEIRPPPKGFTPYPDDVELPRLSCRGDAARDIDVLYSGRKEALAAVEKADMEKARLAAVEVAGAEAAPAAAVLDAARATLATALAGVATAASQGAGVSAPPSNSPFSSSSAAVAATPAAAAVSIADATPAAAAVPHTASTGGSGALARGPPWPSAQYCYAYRARIWLTEPSDFESVQLRSRRWDIDDHNESGTVERECVSGDGVIGLHPILHICACPPDQHTGVICADDVEQQKQLLQYGGDGASLASSARSAAGSSLDFDSFSASMGASSTAAAPAPAGSGKRRHFEYASQMVCGTPKGFMRGSFTMEPGSMSLPLGNGRVVNATIAPFALAVPDFLYL